MSNNAITLTDGQMAAILKLVEVQARGEAKTPETMAQGLIDSVIRGRAIAAAKSAKDNDKKAYNAAKAMGFKTDETLGEFINRRQIEWRIILMDLGLEETAGGEWKRVKNDDNDSDE
jgi:hypothetical protein